MFAKKFYVYHYSAEVFKPNGIINHLDGILRLQERITDYRNGEYKKLKQLICGHFNEVDSEQFDINQLTIKSLSYLGKFK